MAVASAILFWAVTTYFGSSPVWPLVPLLALLLGGVVGGSMAGRWIDVLALALGGALGVSVTGAIRQLEPGAPNDLLFLFPAVVAGILLALIGGATFAVGLGLGPARRPLAGIGVATFIAAGWLLFVAGYSTPQLDSYRIVDPQTIVVVAEAASHSWTRVTDVRETSSEIRINVACLTWLSGPGLDLEPVELTVRLARPLGDRVVMDGGGNRIRLAQGP